MTQPSAGEMHRRVGPKGRYLLERSIGTTRSASLWRAVDTAQEQPVIVEIVRFAPPVEEDSAKRLRDAMAKTQDLPRHPNLLEVLTIHAPAPIGRLELGRRVRGSIARRRGIDEQRWVLVLEPFDGSTLEHQAFSAMSAREVLAVAAQVGDGIAALHAAGVTHGSIGASTVLVDEQGAVKVADALVGTWSETRSRATNSEDVASLVRLVRGLAPHAVLPGVVLGALDPEPSRRPPLTDVVDALREAAEGVQLDVREVPEALDEARAPTEVLDPIAIVRAPDRVPVAGPIDGNRAIVRAKDVHMLVDERSRSEPILPERPEGLIDPFMHWWGPGQQPGEGTTPIVVGDLPSLAPARWMRLASVLVTIVGAGGAVAVIVFGILTSDEDPAGAGGVPPTPKAELSSGPPAAPSLAAVRVPNLAGLTASEARALLVAEGLKLEGLEAVDGKPGEVIRSRPSARSLVEPGTSVVLLVGAEPSRVEDGG